MELKATCIKILVRFVYCSTEAFFVLFNFDADENEWKNNESEKLFYFVLIANWYVTVKLKGS